MQADEFNDAVQVVREWLPHAEAELKFRALPEDEDAIVALMEHHEVLLNWGGDFITCPLYTVK